MLTRLARALAAVAFAFPLAATDGALGQTIAAPASASYVGTPACATCHAKAFEAWRGSQHDRAMAEAGEKTVLGNFANATFAGAGETARFFRRDGKYFVNTRGADGKPVDFEIRYTFGVYPLQQYLVALPGGRLQALGIAWDARPRTEGGQRWFHLFPEGKPKPGDPLHWTGIDQNWNYQCADCHSTNVRKNYDDASRTFRTTWTDIDVGCEACHGPGSNHVAWANAKPEARTADASKGLTVSLDERSGVTWSIDAASGSAARSKPRASNREIETCARCHARRGQFTDAWTPGQPIGDGFRLALIEPGLYYPDGQMRDEVYNYGSFLQSRMHSKGVTCSDCHDPHTQKLRAPANAVCGQCHAPGRYDVAQHHHHAPGTPGAACANCHLPTTTYMVVDPRHDHSMRIPRPDRTVAMGVPNACDRCHAKQGAKWAAAAIARWYPSPKPGYQSFAEAFDAGDRRAPGAAARLAALVTDPAQPAFVRASAIPRLPANPGSSTLDAIAKSLNDPAPLVREVAARTVREADPALRARLLPPLLGDPVRAVRMEAARGLAGNRSWRASAADQARFAAALDEYVAALRFNADRPEAQVDLGSLQLALGRQDEAIASLRRALAIDPTFVPAAVNLADAYRARGLEKDAEAVLAASIKANPGVAAPRHALGLSLARQKRMPEAIAALGEAARLAPDDARYAYVYAVALHDAGRRVDAVRALDRALARHPYDRDMLLASALYEREAGNAGAAAKRVRTLLELEPGNAELQQLAREIGGAVSSKR
jgi:tetratricopeptide (TPR) repeat protein/cytochrome c553